MYCIEAEDLDEGAEVEDVVLDGAAPLQPAGKVPKGLEGQVKVAIDAQGRRVVDRARPLYEDGPMCASIPAPFLSPSSRTSPEGTGLQPPCASGCRRSRWVQTCRQTISAMYSHIVGK